MNINAGTNQYNLSLKKMKEEKRPSFATIFDKLDARSKKLNAKNPLNAVLTNDQMYRYYLSEVEPQLHGSADDFDLEDVIGNKSLKDLKLSEFAKLLSGDLDNTKTTPVYETLTAGVSYNPMIAPLIAPPTLPTPVPTPTPTPPPTIATPVIPAPSSSVASALAPPVPVSGLMPTGTGSIPAAAPAPAVAPVAPVVPAVAPVAPAVAPVAPVVTPVAPVVTPVVPAVPTASVVPVAPAPAPALTISTAPSGIVTPPFSPTSVFASLSSGVSSAVSAVSSLVKPSPSAISVPSSAVASGAATLVAPTPTPISTSGTPSGSPPAAGGLPIDTGGYTDRDRISAFSRALAEGLMPPRMPVSKTKTISKDEDMIKYAIELSKYNDGLKDKKFSIKPTTAVGKMVTIYERLSKRGATEDDIIKEIKKGK